MQDMSMRLGIALLAVCAVAGASPASAQTGGGYDLSWNTIDGGGGNGSTGGTYSLDGTIGQPDAGTASGGGYELAGGFWAGGVVLLLGDCKIDGMVDLFDVVEMIDIHLGKKTATATQTVTCDSNCNLEPADLFDIVKGIDVVTGKVTLPLLCPGS